MNLNWLYIDINSYFATIEQQVDVNLRGKPVIVVPVLSDYSCAIAVSQEAKLQGIKTGTKIHEAKKLCPNLICVLAKHELYVQYHQKIFAEVNKLIYVDYVFSIDEGACRLTGEQSEQEKAVELAYKIKENIKRNVGEYINCSIGIAPNRYLAKIATNMQKPDGLIVITPKDIPTKLYSVKLRDIPAIGYNTHAKLLGNCISSTEELYKVNSVVLRKICGSIAGEKVWHLLRGLDIPVESVKNSSIGHSQVLSPKQRNINDARNVALNLVLKAACRLRVGNLQTANIILSLDVANNKYIKSRTSIISTSDSITLSNSLLKCFDDLIKLHKITSIKKVSINFPKVAKESMQLSFEDLPNKQKSLKNKRLSEAVDLLNKKFGQDTVNLGMIGNKNKNVDVVAFGYIPTIK